MNFDLKFIMISDQLKGSIDITVTVEMKVIENSNNNNKKKTRVIFN